MKVDLPAHEVSLFNTQVNKKENIPFTVIEYYPPDVKNEVLNSVWRASLIGGSTSLMSLFFSFNFDENRKFLQT